MWSLLLLKPDLVAHPPILREALREILAAGVTIGGARRLQLTREHTERLYGAHRGRNLEYSNFEFSGKFFYSRLVRHVSSGPVIAMRVSGDVRSLLGSSRLWPLTSTPTLRQRLALSDVRNVAHNSDVETAMEELSLFEPLPPAEPLLRAILADDNEDMNSY